MIFQRAGRSQLPDQIPTLANPTSQLPLHGLSASMRRIGLNYHHLIFKLINPIFISFAITLLGRLRKMAPVLAEMGAILE